MKGVIYAVNIESRSFVLRRKLVEEVIYAVNIKPRPFDLRRKSEFEVIYAAGIKVRFSVNSQGSNLSTRQLPGTTIA